MNITKKNRTETTHNESKWTAYDTISVIIKSLAFIAIFAAAIYFYTSIVHDAVKVLGDTNSYSEAYKAVSDGVIVDKQLVSSHANALRPSSTEYRIYVTSEYIEENGTTITITKYFSVPEATYLSYDIGDYFNSHNYKTGAEIDDV